MRNSALAILGAMCTLKTAFSKTLVCVTIRLNFVRERWV